MKRLWWWMESSNMKKASGSNNSSKLPQSPPRRARLSSREYLVHHPTTGGTTGASTTADGATSIPTTEHQHQQQPISPRRRINSHDIPRSYNGLYGFSGDMLPFEMNRHRGTLTSQSVLFLLACYVTLLTVLQATAFMIFQHRSWTATNAIHLILSMIYLHWLKGSLFDEQGEMNALTVWEQLDATVDTRPVRQILLIVPTILTYVACHISDYQPVVCAFNASIWMIAILPKLSFMHGVRLFGINRTVGIDDATDDFEEDDDYRTKTTFATKND